MQFRDRQEAGRLMANALSKYKGQDVVVYALPRGGVVNAAEIALALQAPLDLILAHKIGHPYQPEYAIGAVSEHGQSVVSSREVHIDKAWFEAEKKRQMQELKKKRALYLKGRPEIPIKGKIAILVDDGIATGLTMQAGILDLKQRHPQKIVVAVPVAPRSTAELLGKQADEFVGLEIPEDYYYRGAVGSYYDNFSQTLDEEVIELLEKCNKSTSSKEE
jgi:putative phosphoribosyl transferase